MKQRLPNFGSCFVCGDRNPAGLGVRFRVEEGTVFATFTPREPHMGYRGITHGGVLAALLDETMGWSPAVRNRRFCVAVEITVRFLKPLPLGTEVVVTGRTVSDSRRIWEAEGEVAGADGQVYARGRGRYVPLSDEETRAVLDYLTFYEGCVAPESLHRP